MPNSIDLYAVIGNPIAHSLSPKIHKLFAKQCQQNLKYTSILATPATFEQTFINFFKNGGKGLNITSPFKTTALKFCHNKTKSALLANATNLIIKKNGKLLADNVDGIGLITDIKNNLNWNLTGKKILILGAGGAAAGVLPNLIAEQPTTITICNRTITKAKNLADTFNTTNKTIINICSYIDLNDQQFDIIINATSANLHNQTLIIPNQIINTNCHCYDMSYAAKSEFLFWSKQHGAIETANGIGMLIEQAAESFYRWRHIKPNTKPLLKHLYKLKI